MALFSSGRQQLRKKLSLKPFIPWHIGAGCCQVELESIKSATYNWERLGILDVAIDSSEADLLLVSGWINSILADEIKNIYNLMPSNKKVLAIGVCAISGSTFKPGCDKPIILSDLIPVDVYVPGCPPRPETLLNAIMVLDRCNKTDTLQEQMIYEALTRTR